MVVLRPSSVAFDGVRFGDVEQVTFDSFSLDMAETWGEDGPELMFADSVRRKTTATVAQSVSRTELEVPELGSMGELVVELTPGSDALARTVTMDVVVQSVKYTVDMERTRREIRFVGVSDDGETPPVRVSADTGGV